MAAQRVQEGAGEQELAVLVDQAERATSASVPPSPPSSPPAVVGRGAAVVRAVVVGVAGATRRRRPRTPLTPSSEQRRHRQASDPPQSCLLMVPVARNLPPAHERSPDHRGRAPRRPGRRWRPRAPSSTSGGRNASAIPWPSTGEKLPLVTSPAGAPSRSTDLLGARGPAALDRQPAETAGDAALPLGDERHRGPGSRPACPRRPPSPRPAWSGVIPGPSSWPCSGSAASRRRVSRAPRPGGNGPGAEHRLPHDRGQLGRHRQLHAVLAGVARAGHGALGARRPMPCRRGSDRRRPPRARSCARRSRAAGPCTAMIARLGGDVLAADGRHHPVGVGGVRHDVEHVVGQPPHDDVVEHRRVGLVEQVGVLGPPRRDLAEVVRERGLQALERPGALHPHRARGGSRRRPRRPSGRPCARRWCRRRRTSGMSQPPKGTILAPRARWAASRGEVRKVTSGNLSGGDHPDGPFALLLSRRRGPGRGASRGSCASARGSPCDGSRRAHDHRPPRT